MKTAKLFPFIASLGLLLSTSVNAREIHSLWELTDASQQLQHKGHTHLSQPVNISINQQLIKKFEPGDIVNLPLFTDSIQIELTGAKDSLQTRVWRGKNLTSKHLPEAHFFVQGERVSAWIPTSKGTYRVENGQLIKEIPLGGDINDIHTAQEPKARQAEIITDAHVTRGSGISSTQRSQQNTDDSVLNYRVLFVVTPEFKSRYPQTSAKINEYITVNNAIYTASKMQLQMVNAGIVEADLESFTAAQILDNISSSQSSDSTDGQIPKDRLTPIWQARLANKADNITVMRDTLPNGLCGLGWKNGNTNQTYSYKNSANVTAANTTFEGIEQPQFCGFSVLGHEIGHNMGLGHSLKQDDPGSIFTYGRGYGVADKFTTVMAYPQEFGSAEEVALYSSPALTCQEDIKCGIAGDKEDGADAVSAVNQVKYQFSLIHNDEVLLPINDAFNGLSDDFVSCLNSSNTNLLTNLGVRVADCGDDFTLTSYRGLEKFPNLQFLQVAAEDGDLSPFKHINNLSALDFRLSKVSNLRSIAHLQGKITFLQFHAERVTCQEVKVLESWNIEVLSVLAQCQSQSSDSQDFDGDGTNNLNDTDDDNDGINDIADIRPFDASNRGDIDGDGVADEKDAFPYDESETLDTDRDTVGNNRDRDDDNDGVADDKDCAPLDANISENCGNNNNKKFIAYDYDGDGKADVGVRRASTFFQYILNSKDGEIQRVQFGKNSGDITVSGDFDKDNIADIAVRRPSNQFWYIKNSSNGEIQRINFGKKQEDIPVPADYDGDGTTDIAVRRPSNKFWYILNSSDGEIQRIHFGKQDGDIPVPADYDGDGKVDVAVRRPSNQFWYILNTSDGEIQRINFGKQQADIPVPADYDGDGKADVAVRRPSNQFWYILNSSDGEIQRINFGKRQEDIPIPADYDGDGKVDVAVRRPSTHFQYILRSSDGEIERIQFGRNSGDMPLAGPISTRVLTTISTQGGQATTKEQPLIIKREIISVEQAKRDDVL